MTAAAATPTTATDRLLAFRQERGVLVARLARTDALRDRVNEIVFARVRADYLDQAAAIEAEIAELLDEARRELAAYERELASRQRALTETRHDLEELLLRHDLGELDDETVTPRRAELDDAISVAAHRVAELAEAGERFAAAFPAEDPAEAEPVETELPASPPLEPAPAPEPEAPLEERFAALPLFEGFSDDDLALLARTARLLTAEPGDVVAEEGSMDGDLLVVLSGRVAVERETPFGPFRLAILTPGALVGEAAFVDAAPRIATIRATESTEVSVFAGTALSSLAAHAGPLGLLLYRRLWHALADKLRGANDRLLGFFEEAAVASGRLVPEKVESRPFQRDAWNEVLAAGRLTASEIDLLASMATEKPFPSGSVIFAEGAPGDRMFALLSGRVLISKTIPGVGKEALAFLEPGDFFGEMALIGSGRRSATAEAHVDSIVLAIPRDAVEELLGDAGGSVRLIRTLCSLLARRLREVDEKLVGWFLLSGGPT